jgi:hypothetical protein
MFYFAWDGNKRNELKYIYELLENIQYDKVIEPFGGSCAFSRDQYDKNDKLEIYISDLNNELTLFCNNFYKYDEDIIKTCVDEINKISNKEEYIKKFKEAEEHVNNLTNAEQDIIKFCGNYLLFKTYYYIRPGLYPSSGRKPTYKGLNRHKDKINNFFKKFNYVNQDYKIYMERYRYDEKALIFIDPPYINSSNESYKHHGSFKNIDMRKTFSDVWEYLYKFVNDCKCHFIIIVNDNIFMNLAFNKFFYNSYDKTYSNTKNKCNHVIYTNIRK